MENQFYSLLNPFLGVFWITICFVFQMFCRNVKSKWKTRFTFIYPL